MASSSPPDPCPVCLEPTQDRHVYPTCGHGGCAVCLSTWRKVSNACPLCKQTSLFLEPADATPDPATEESAAAIEALKKERDDIAFMISPIYLDFVRSVEGHRIDDPIRTDRKYDGLIDQVIALYGKQVAKYPMAFWASRRFHRQLRRLDWQIDDLIGCSDEQIAAVLSSSRLLHFLMMHQGLTVVVGGGLVCLVGIPLALAAGAVVLALASIAVPALLVVRGIRKMRHACIPLVEVPELPVCIPVE